MHKEITPITAQSLGSEREIVGTVSPDLTGHEDAQVTGMSAEHQLAPEEQPTHTVLFDFSGDYPTMLIDSRTITEFAPVEICALWMLLLMYPNKSVISNTDSWGKWTFTDYTIKYSKVFTNAFGEGFNVRSILNVLVPKLEQLDIPGLSFKTVSGGGIAVDNPYKDLVRLYFSPRGKNDSVIHIETVSAPINPLQKLYVEALLVSYSEAAGTWLTAEEILRKVGREVTAHTVGGVLNSLRTVGNGFYSNLTADTVGINYDLIIQIKVEKIAGKDRAKFRVNPQIQVTGPKADV